MLYCGWALTAWAWAEGNEEERKEGEGGRDEERLIEGGVQGDGEEGGGVVALPVEMNTTISAVSWYSQFCG